MRLGRRGVSEIVVDGLTFPEAPRWHDGKRHGSPNFYTHRVLTVDAAGHLEIVVDVPQRPSGLGWTPDGALLVVSMLDHRLLRFDGGLPRVVADLSAVATGPCNDMVVDAAGRADVGNFGFDRHRGEQPRTTWVRVDPDGSVVRAADDLLFPNGTVMTPDGRTLIVAETFASRLTVFDVGADGALSGRRLFARIEGCFPDGICRDAERAVWWPTPGQPGDPRALRRAGRPDDLDRTPRSVRLHAGRRRPTDPVRVHQQGQRSRHGPRDRPAHRGLPGRRSRRRASLVSRGPRPGPVARDVSAVPWRSRDGRTGSWPPDVSISTAHRRRTG
jgi:sugar lactone lactonase YvrE